MNTTAASHGGLTCRVVGEDNADPELLVVLCHGFGAPGTDLVPFASELLGSSPDLQGRVRFAFPEAPLSLAEWGMFDARAWWMLDVPAVSAAIERDELRHANPEDMPGAVEARDMLLEATASLAGEAGLPLSRTILGGFSQGAMLSTDVALRLPETPAGLCILSGTLVAEEEWRRLAGVRGAMPVLQSHGRFDPLLPFSGALSLRDALVESGLSVDFLEFDGVHTVPYEALQRMMALMSAVTE